MWHCLTNLHPVPRSSPRCGWSHLTTPFITLGHTPDHVLGHTLITPCLHWITPGHTFCITQTTPTQRAAREGRKDLLERLGSRSPLATFTATLTAALLPSLITPEAAQGLAALACPLPDAHLNNGQKGLSGGSVGEGGSQQDMDVDGEMNGGGGVSVRGGEQLAQGARSLLAALAKAVPSLLAPAVPHLAKAVVAAPCVELQLPGGGAAGGGGKAGGKRRAQGRGKGSRAPLLPGDPATQATLGGGVGMEEEEEGKVPEESPALITSVRVLANAGQRYMEVWRKQGGSENRAQQLEALPPQLQPRLMALCRGGSPKVAAAAVYAVVGVEVGSATQLLTRLSGRLAQQLVEPGCLEGPAGLAAVHGLCAVGSFAPALFAGACADVRHSAVIILCMCLAGWGVGLHIMACDWHLTLLQVQYMVMGVMQWWAPQSSSSDHLGWCFAVLQFCNAMQCNAINHHWVPVVP